MTAALRKIRTVGNEVELCGVGATLDLSGALYLSEYDTLVIADLHLEKGSSLARRGLMLPPYDTRDTLAALGEVIGRYRPGTVVALGDSFHDVGGPERVGLEEGVALAALRVGRRWIWLTGNHDRVLPDSIGGEVSAELTLGPLTLRHSPEPGRTAEIAGHLHPAGKVVLRGRGVRRRCFVSDGERMVLPAFGAYAGGLNVCNAAFKPLFPRGFTAHLIGDGRVFAIGKAMLCRD